MEFRVYSRHAFERAAPPAAPHVVISIRSRPDAPLARVTESPRLLAVAQLAFLDVDPTQPDVDAADYPPDALFGRDHARAIWDLVAEHHARLACVVVHCNAGRHRSPAVAAALSRALTGRDREFFARYPLNRLVYRTMLETFHREYVGWFPRPAADDDDDEAWDDADEDAWLEPEETDEV